MNEPINWLHLTDLHYGLDDQSWLWPRVKNEFFKDVEKKARLIGGIDIVFFTGDFVQAGKKEEYDQLNKELDALWKVLVKCGRNPKLCAVPGNHDLVRPHSDSSVTKALTKLWSTDVDLRKLFWRDGSCEYRQAIESCFANYKEWHTRLSVPTLDVSPGVLPGDFSATFSKSDVTLGIIGLNSTFLQIAGGDFEHRLDLHVSQLNSVCEGDPDVWLSKRSGTVLLTHQPPNWLNTEALNHFRQEIYPPGRFIAQLCGHQHIPDASECSEAGALPRRLRQAASLFGLEFWNGDDPKIRIHGYTLGQYFFDDDGITEKYWPRVAVKGRHGGLNLGPDHSFTLKDECVVSRFDLPNNDVTNSDDAALPKPMEDSSPIECPIAQDPIPINLLERELDDKVVKIRLESFPRLTLNVGDHHRFVRQEEQSECENGLRKSRCLWIVAEWAKEDGFLASCIERFHTPNQLVDAFHIRCDDASDVDGLEAWACKKSCVS